MSKSLKTLILVVLMFAHVMLDLQNNVNISDSNSATPLLEDTQRNLSEKQKKSQSKLPDAPLPSCNASTPSDINANSSQCNDSSLNVPSDKKDEEMALTKAAEEFVKSRLTTVFLPSFYTLVFIISVPLNIGALLVFVLRVKPKKAASIYMMNLAVADLLFAASLPFKIFYHFNGNSWIFGSATCRMVTAAFFWNMYCSVLLIASISVDRLLVVVYPMESLSWRSSRKAVIVCVAMWVLSFAGTIPLLTTKQAQSLPALNITTCYDLFPDELLWFYTVYFITLTALLIFLPLIITVVSYTQVIKTLRKAQPSHEHKKRRAVVLALTVLVMFLICFTPTNCLFVASFSTEDLALSEALATFCKVFQCLGSVNCLLDPLVYFFGSSKFHKELCSLLGCLKIGKGTGSSRRSSSDPSASTSQTVLKSNSKETNISLTNRDSSQANLGPVAQN